MARRGKHRARLNWMVILIVAVVAAFCILNTLQEKYGMNVGIPEIEIPSLDFIYDIVDGITGDENTTPTGNDAVAVSAQVKGDGITVHMLDMGQADSILILGPKKTVLIDAGENGQGAQVIRYLEEQGVKKIDLLIGTHPHSDHIGGMDTVVRQFPVGEVVLPEIPGEIVPTTATYTDLLTAIGEKGLEITVAEPGLRFDLGDNAALTILGPVAQYTDLNNMSVVSKVEYGEISFLFAGDAGAQAEAGLLEKGADLSADVLQVPHHGSNSSSTEAFLDAVSPRVALISCGLDNSYGHPHREVMERLQQRELQVHRTDLDGAIVVFSEGQRVYISTEN